MAKRTIPLAELRRDLRVTDADVRGSMSDETRAQMQRPGSENIVLPIGSDYAFECACCAVVGMDQTTYRLIKETRGPGLFIRTTLPNMIKSTKGIFRLEDLDFVPDNSSVLNMTDDGPVCDHCYDSVYNSD